MDCPRCKTEIKNDPYRAANAEHIRREALERVAHAAGVEIDHCKGCGGTFLDHGELEKIQIAARKTTSKIQAPSREQRVWARAQSHAYVVGQEPREEPAPLVCPACGGEMAERDWGFGSEVTIDTCIECRGVWLDFGELEALEDVFR